MISISQERGCATMTVAEVQGQSVVTSATATSPLKLLTPRSRGRLVCTYLSNLGGGLVAGDHTRLELSVGRKSRCFLGTQASTKVYRNPKQLPCGHATVARIEAEAALVFAPAPVQPFAESTYEQRQQFHLAPEAGLVMLDWFTAGRTACGERWQFARFSTRNEIWRLPPADAKARPQPVLLDACCLDAVDGPVASPYRTGRFNCFALLVVLGEPFQMAAQRLLESVGQLPVPRRASLLACVSPLQDGAVLRLAGEQVAEVEQCLRRHLAPVAELLGEDPWARQR